MPRAKSNDPRNFLKDSAKVLSEQEVSVAWSARTDDFPKEHFERIWDLAFQESLKLAIEYGFRKASTRERLEVTERYAKLACEFADTVTKIYAEHRKSNPGIFVEAKEIING